jgi:uncharacterized RDD family membrane protein YckC
VLIDTLVLLPVSILPNLVLNLGPKEEVACPGRTSLVCEQPTSGARALALILTLVALVVAVIYYSQLEGKKGQTVGKQALGIRVVDINSGEVIGVSRGVGRYFARWLSALPCGLGYFWMLWDGQKQTWHDKLTSAVVVRT